MSGTPYTVHTYGGQPYMTVLTAIQQATLEIAQDEPSNVVGNSNTNARRLLAYLYRAADLAMSEYTFSETIRSKTTLTETGQASYALPQDFMGLVPDTHWDKSGSWIMYGMASKEYQAAIVDDVSASPYIRYIIQGVKDNRYTIYPTPTADDNELVYNYYSNQWFLPKLWAAAETVSSGTWRSYNGNIYYVTTGGTCGSTAPTHTTGDASDGTLTWTYKEVYPNILSDDDMVMLPPNVIVLKLASVWKERMGFDNSSFERDYRIAADRAVVTTQPSETKQLGLSRNFRFATIENLPDKING